MLLWATCMFAQAPNAAYRLPVTPDMPDWAQLLYQNDAALNVFDLDGQVAPWQSTYEHLKAQVAAAGTNVPAELMEEFRFYKKYYKYYTRWRYSIAPYMQSDGSLVFTPPPTSKSEPAASAENSTTWQLVGPTITYWAKNDNAAQPPAPWQANVYSLAVAPSNSSVLYYGTETGAIGKTTNKGTSWTPVGLTYTGFRSGIGALAVDRTNTNIVYAGTNTGIHKTTDGGTVWTQVLNVANFNTNDIKVHPANAGELIAAGSSLRRYTTAGGWVSIISRTTYDLAYKTNNSSVVYALVRNAAGDRCEFYKSTNSGVSFTLKSSGWISNIGDGGGRLCVTPADPNRVYVVLLTTQGPRVLRSTDSGETWTLVASGGTTALPMTNGQGYYDLSITASHTNAQHLVLGTSTAYKSTDGGVNYTAVGGYSGPFDIHPDIQEMVTVGSDSWIATDGGINLSTDFWTNTANFTPKIDGMTGTHFWGFDIGWNEDCIVGGRYHNGNTAWHENYPAGNFLRMGGGEQATGYVNPANSRMVYFSDLGNVGRILPATINQNFGTFTVTKSPNESYFSMDWSEQKWDPRYSGTYFLGKNNILWKTTDNGANFTALFTHSDATAIVLCPDISRTNPDVLYCSVKLAASGELWKSTNGGTDWTQCTNPTGPTDSQRRLSKVVVSGTDANTIWWCFRNGPNGSKIFRSTDGGSSWTNITTTTLNGVVLADMVHQLGTDGGIYLNGDFGKVYYRNNTMPDWVSYATGLPVHLNTEISRMKIQYPKKKLRMASVNGVWEVDLFEPSTTTLPQAMVDNLAPACSRDTIQLESYSVMNGTAAYQWNITPAPQWISNANARNPRMVLGTTPGSYNVQLTVTDDNGITSRTFTGLINNLALGDLCSADTIPGKSLVLDGSGDFALANSSLNLNSNRVTMTAWVKRNGAQVDFSGLLYWRGGTTSCGLSITSGNALRYTWDEQGGSYNFNTGFTIPDNTWTHVALVVTPNDATVYMNGVAATRTTAHAAEAFDTPLKIGFDNGSRYFKGQIDEVTVWNRSLSQDSIRELMHLTIPPSNEPNLVSYYQFNEVNGASVQDKVANCHASMVGNATRMVSTCPVGKGTSARVTVNSEGTYLFGETGLTLTFPTGGTYPNGELCATRINQSPDQTPGGLAHGHSYWVVNNFGSNSTFTPLTSVLFEAYENIPTVVPAADFQLYKRSSFADGATWGTAVDAGDVFTPGVHSAVLFSTGNNISSFRQLVVTNSAPLPVEWMSFRAAPEKNTQVRLDWTVNQFDGTGGYIVERSADGIHFEAIFDIPARAETGVLAYIALDKTPLDGRNFYRIKQLDLDGRFTYSGIRMVQFGGNAVQWSVFPNPVKSGSVLYVQTTVDTPYTFTLMDAVGKTVVQRNLQGSAEIEELNLPAGVYQYVLLGQQQRITGQVVVWP